MHAEGRCNRRARCKCGKWFMWTHQVGARDPKACGQCSERQKAARTEERRKASWDERRAEHEARGYALAQDAPTHADAVRTLAGWLRE